MPKSDFEAMAAAGFCQVFIGLESGSAAVRDAMKKGFSQADFEYTTTQLFNNGIAQSWNIFVGFPTETDDDFEQTLYTIEKYSREFGKYLTVTPIGIFQAITGSPVDTHNLFDLKREYVNGHTEISWGTPLNPSNTLAKRIERWEKLIALVHKLDVSNRSADKLALLTNFYKQVLCESKNTTKIISITKQESSN